MISVKRHILFLLVLSFIIGCQTDIDEMTIDDVVPAPDVIVRADLRGIVTDQNNEPIQGAEVKAGNDVLLTDEWGYFSFQLAGLDASGALITIKKNGYFNGSRYFKPSLKDNYIQVKLIEERNVGSFNALNGATIDLNDEAQIIFPADIFQFANGDPYNGMVNVSAYWLDPTLPEMGELMPSNLVGKNLANESVALASLGMMVVELTSNSGQTIKIKEGSQAELLFPIPIAMQATAPAIMPLWSFTESQKIWIQEGQASLEGNYYRAKVSHFSWWNCDWPYPAIALTGKLIYESDPANRTAAPNIKVRISLVDRPWNSSVVYSNSEGIFNSVIPASSLIRLEILDECDEVEMEQEIGPFSTDIDLDEIVIENLSGRMVSISGILVDCDTNAIQNGYAIFKYGVSYSIVEVQNNGLIETNILICEGINDISVTGYNIDRLEQGFNTLFLLEDDVIDFGTLNVCQAIEEYFSITIDGTTFYNFGPYELVQVVDYNPIGNAPKYLTFLFFNSPGNENSVTGSMLFGSNGTGSYSESLLVGNVSLNFNDLIVSGFDTIQGVLNGNIYEFDTEPGGLVHIEFDGALENADEDLKDIMGSFKVKVYP